MIRVPHNMTYAPIRSLLIANRSEIAIRVMRAAAEMDIHTVSIYSKEDRLALHRFKADESYFVGAGKKPLAAYLDIEDVLRIAKQTKVDAIHPGYGFLSENPDFAQAVMDAGIRWIGPTPPVMRMLGNKVAARIAAGLYACRHSRVPDGCGFWQVLLYRGQPSHPGGAHCHRDDHRRRYRQGTDSHHRRRQDWPRRRFIARRRRHQPARCRRTSAGENFIERACAAMPNHDRGSGQWLLARLWAAHRLP